MKLSTGLTALGNEILDPETASGEEIRERLLGKAREALIKELDLREQDGNCADALTSQGCKEIEVGWRDGKVQAYLHYNAGTAMPLAPAYCGDLNTVLGKINAALEGVGVNLVDPDLYVVMDDQAMTREEAGELVVSKLAEVRDLLSVLGTLDLDQVQKMKGVLTRLIGALKSTGNTGELLTLVRGLASHDAQ